MDGIKRTKTYRPVGIAGPALHRPIPTVWPSLKLWARMTAMFSSEGRVNPEDGGQNERRAVVRLVKLGGDGVFRSHSARSNCGRRHPAFALPVQFAD